MAKNVLSDMSIDLDKVKKVKAAEENLSKMLQKINEEIIKTEVEWMHLRSLVDKKPTSSTHANQPTSALSEKLQKQTKFQIDDVSLNQTEINLSLLADRSEASEEESDQ